MSNLPQIYVRKCGLRLKSPAVVILYEKNIGADSSASVRTYRKRTMPVRRDLRHSSIRSLAQDLRERHPIHLESVPTAILDKMLRILQEYSKCENLDDCLKVVEKEFKIDPFEDLNKLDDDTVQLKKKIMDVTFEKNRIKPGDEDFVYDKEIDFNEVQDNAIETCGWDSDNDDDSF